MKFMEGRFCWLIILMLLSLTASGNHIIGATNQSTQHTSHPLQPQAQPSAPTQSMLGWQALTSPSTANLLRNGGFEDGLDSHGVPVSWQFVGQVAPANVLRLDPRASEGKWALRIKPVMVPHDIATVGISQRVAVNPGSSLFVSVDVQSNTQIAPVACFLVIEFQPGITRSALKLTPSINQYQTFEQQVVVPSDAHIMQLTLYVQLHRDLDLLVDNFIVAVTGTQMESGVQRMPQRLWSAQRIMRLQSHTPAFGVGQVRAYQRVIDPNYTVRPGDQLVVQMRSATVGERWMELPVDVQGQVQIPNIGFIRIVGMRVSEVRQMLQMMMQKSYRDPQLELEIVEVRSPTGISTTKFTTTTVGKPPVVQRPSVGIRIENLLRNGSFEEGLDINGLPIGWQCDGVAPGMKLFDVDSRASDGKQALRIRSPKGLHSTGVISIFQLIPVEPNATLTLAVDMQNLSSVQPVKCYMVIEFEPDAMRAAMKLTPSQGGYQTFTQEVIVPDTAQRASFKLQFQLNAGMDILVDNARVTVARASGQRLVQASQIREVGAGLQPYGIEFFKGGTAWALPLQGPIPPEYRLGAGDELILRMWSPVMEERVLELQINSHGQVHIPSVGFITIAGRTLAEAQEILHRMLREYYKDVRVHVSIGKLRSVQITVIGEAVRPGSYLLTPLSTLFTALRVAGGPSHRGSFRNIELRRAGRVVAKVDLYQYLMRGDTTQDIPLEDGDTIFIPVVGPTVTVLGEVKRPAIYELKGGERLKDILEMAGGIKATAYGGRIQVLRVVENREQVVLDVEASQLLTGDDQSRNILLQDGDEVRVFKVVERPEAVVHISGPVRRPGTYQYRPGMRIRDLLSVAEGLLPDAQVFWERAEIYRTGADKREQLITFNLKAVLDGEEDANIQLKPGDRVVIYREEEVRAPLTVTASGALQRPGTYKLTAGMTVKDLLMAAGGLREDAYSKRAELWRRTDGYLRQIITLNLDEILRDGKHDVPLQPFDELRVYRPDEILVPPSVVVRGCVQMPGTYEYAVGMHLSDLLAAAGGILPNAYRKRADLIRYDEGEERVLYSVDIERVLAHDPSHDLELQPRDELIVYSDEEVRTPHIVQIQGAVQRPGSYPRPMNMRVSDLLFQAGGLLPNAYTERAFLIRQHPNGVSKLVVINLDRAQAGDPKHDLLLRDHDNLLVYARDDVLVPRTVKIIGAVRRQGSYPYRDGMKLSDLITQAGGLLQSAYLERADITRMRRGKMPLLITVNLERMQAGDESADVELRPYDEVRIYTEDEAQAERREWFVRIAGAVQRPGTYPLRKGMRIKDLIEQAGGLLPAAAKVGELGRFRANTDEVNVIKVELERALQGDPEANIELQPRDTLTIARVGEYIATAKTVTISGAVKRPGEYIIKEGDTLYQLIQRAGGLTEDAYPQGIVFKRRPELLITQGQQETVTAVATLTERLAELQYESWLAAQPSGGAVRRIAPPRVPVTTTPTVVAQAAAEAMGAVAGAVGEPKMAAPPRRIGMRGISGRIAVDLIKILETKGREGDIMLEDGDVIYIPKRPQTVIVAGAVMRPSAIVHEEGKRAKDYIAMAGGFAMDANRRNVIVIKANGRALTLRHVKAIEPGDVIYVPPKALMVKVPMTPAQRATIWTQILTALALALFVVK